MNFDIDELSQSESGRNQIMNVLDRMNDQQYLKNQELIYWSYYHNLKDSSKYDYLRKVGDFEFPALVRNISHQRSFINLLTSSQARRPWVFTIRTSDIKSREEKYEKRLRNTLRLIFSATQKKISMVNQQINQYNQYLQSLNNIANSEPQTPEDAEKQAEIKQQLPIIQGEVMTATEILNKEIMLSRADLNKIEKYNKYEYKDIKDEMAEFIFSHLKKTLGLHKIGIKNFISQAVTGREYFFVDYIIGEKYPRIKRQSTLSISYPNIETVEWVEDGPWVRIDEYWSYNEVMKNYGHLMTEEQRKALLTINVNGSSNGGHFVTTDGSNAIFVPSIENNVISSSGNGIKVTRYYWKAEREIKCITKPNKKSPGKFFRHFVTGKKILMSTDYSYNNQMKKWVSKVNPNDTFDPKDVEVVNEANGDKLEVRYIDDRYDGVMIANRYQYSWRSPIQLRSEDNYRDVKLPVVGPTHNGLADYPYSLIGATIPFADTIELLYYHRELLLALQNVAGLVIDFSQKPSSFSKSEWYYQMKLGRYIIETIRDGNKVSSFNQFQRVDGGLGPSIQYIDNMINNTYNFMGETIGIPRQRKGEVLPSDQVGTFEKSVEQSNLITEIVFDDHDTVCARAYAMLVNLHARYCLEKDTNITIDGNDIRMIKIQAKAFDATDLEVFVEDDGKAEKKLAEMKAFMKQQLDGGKNISLGQFLQVYLSDSVKQVEKFILQFADEADQLQQQILESQGQSEERKIQAQAEAQMAVQTKLKELEAQIKMSEQQYNAQLEQAKMEYEKAFNDQKLAIEAKKVENASSDASMKNNLKLMELLNEQQVETSYLAESKEARMIQNKLEALELKMNALINGVSLELQKKSKELDHKRDLKKIDADIQKAKKQSKEHVSDR